jgi:DNA mismatch repair protein MSH3
MELSISEIYQNQTDGGVYGSLLWLLDQYVQKWSDVLIGSCKTRMGRRLMREWIGRPLLDIG